MGESQGQRLLLAVERWISSWVAFPDVPNGQGLVAALWAIHTWFAPKWPATAYAHITGDGPGVGKTVLLEVLKALSCNGKMRATLRPLEVVRAIEQCGSVVTYFFDEVEKLSSAGASDMRSILTSGYRKGGQHGITSGKESLEFSTYCAKAFASIGDLEEVFRSRSIVFRLTWGSPARSWTDAVMVRDGEAEQLVQEMTRVFAGAVPQWQAPDGLVGREREIWTPLHSVALGLKLDAATMKRVRNAMHDMSAWKSQVEARGYRDIAQVSKDDDGRKLAERCLRDLASVMPGKDEKSSGDIFTRVALAALRELDGPWRVFKGRGLDADTLAGLVSRFGVEPKTVRMERGRKSATAMGYGRVEVQAALERLAKAEGPKVEV